MPSVGQELLNVPFPEMILKLSAAIAEGQFKLDLVSMKIAKAMTKIKIPIPNLTTDPTDFTEVEMIVAGFQPTFYQFTDTIIEVKMAISMCRTTSAEVSISASGGWGPFSASVNAKYASTYTYSVEGSSLLRTKITPVPPNTFILKLFEMKAQLIQKEQMNKIEAAEQELKKQNEEIAKKAEGETE